MLGSSQYCQDHQNQTLTNICIANHNCNIKICPECTYQNHRGIRQTQMIPFDIFKQTTLPTFNKNFNELKDIQKSELKSEFKQFIQDMENFVKRRIQTLKDQMEIKYNTILEEDQIYENLYNRLTEDSLTEFSKKDLQKMISITQSDQFSYLVKKRKENIWNIKQSIQKIEMIFMEFERSFQKLELESAMDIIEINSKSPQIMKKQITIPLVLRCPPGCVCGSQTSQLWKHSCGRPFCLSEYGLIYCKVCHKEPEKGCFIKEFPFKCSIAQTYQYFRSAALFLSAFPQEIEFKGLGLNEKDIADFGAKLTAEVTGRWYR